MSIDFQGLLNVLKAAEAEQRFSMATWIEEHPCGTSHCMIGAFCAQNPQDKLYLLEPLDHPVCAHPKMNVNGEILRDTKAISERFGITPREVHFLFTNHTRYRLTHSHRGNKSWFATKTRSAITLDKKRALTRLRKFIYYKLHKSEMTLEVARRVEGNKAVIHASKRVAECSV